MREQNRFQLDRAGAGIRGKACHLDVQWLWCRLDGTALAEQAHAPDASHPVLRAARKQHRGIRAWRVPEGQRLDPLLVRRKRTTMHKVGLRRGRLV